MDAENNFSLSQLFGDGEVWNTAKAFEAMRHLGLMETRRTAERKMLAANFFPGLLDRTSLYDENGVAVNRLVLDMEIETVQNRRRLHVFARLHEAVEGALFLHANDARKGRSWVMVEDRDAAGVRAALQKLLKYLPENSLLFPCGQLVAICRQDPMAQVSLLAYAPKLTDNDLLAQASPEKKTGLTPHLARLEAESIHILREAVAEGRNPVMLYSVGKDSGVMLHLARKAFYPEPPPFPLLHVDTRWKFQEMYLFRDHMARLSGMNLMVYVNPEAVAKDINPFDHGSALHTDITKTEGLKQVLSREKFDMVFGGARRDEEKSRAKERVFSFRSASHHWDPKMQRPELWDLYNTRKAEDESIRVFPLSNWTELDIWQYIYHEQIPVVPLYFAKERPVVERDGMLIMVDDNRFRLLPGEKIQRRMVRFRTLGCYPLTGAVESEARSIEDILLEVAGARTSERQGRKIDSDTASSMEAKKKEGYF